MATRPLPTATAASSAETTNNETGGTAPRLAPSSNSMAVASRRTFLSGAAALPAAMVATVAACSPPTPAAAQGMSAELLALIAHAKTVEDTANAHTAGPLDEAETRTYEAIDAVPHHEMNVGPSVTGRATVRTTAEPYHVAMNRKVVEMGTEGKFPPSQGLSLERRFRAVCLRRERAINAIRRRSGVAELAAANDALWSECSAARDAVASFLVRNPADLACKLAFMVKHQMGDGVDWLPELLADARALANVEG